MTTAQITDGPSCLAIRRAREAHEAESLQFMVAGEIIKVSPENILPVFPEDPTKTEWFWSGDHLSGAYDTRLRHGVAQIR